MDTHQTMVDEIVRKVLLELQRRTACADGNGKTPEVDALDISDRLVTEASLVDRLDGVVRVRFAAATVVTPSALDLLRSRRIPWSRQSGPDSSRDWSARTGLVSQETLSGLPVTCHSASGFRNLVERTVELIRKSEHTTVVGLTDRPAAAACLANRDRNVCAAAVHDTSKARTVLEEVRPHIVFFAQPGHGELQRVLRLVAEVDPQRPEQWELP